jgi:plastocyanin
MLAFALGISTAGPVGAGEVVVIEMFQYQFVPDQVTIKPGTRVRWMNKEKRQFHNVWFREAGEEPGEYLFPEDEYERVFDQVGDYPYVCQPHQNRMRGRIIVAE